MIERPTTPLVAPDWKNVYLSDHLYKVAQEPSWFNELLGPTPWWRRTWWRLRNWIDDHWPRVHLGPCNHEDC